MFSEEGYRALTTAAAVVRRADRGVLTVTGADRLTWLQGLVTNDVLAVPVGGMCEAAYLTPQGRMITDLRVINLRDRALLDVPASLSGALAKRLDALLFSEQAEIVDSSAELVVVELHGPSAPGLVREPRFVRHDAFEVPGFTAVVPAAEAGAVVATLLSAGAVETTLETLDVLRIEAGRPAFLVDMDEQTIPLEAGLEQRAISFSKGCYVGQEVVIRILHRGGGRVAKKLVGFRLDKAPVPRGGEPIIVDGREIGRLTSAAWSPALSAAIGIGYVHRDYVTPGTVVELRSTGGEPLSAVVTALPFVTRGTSGAA
jgi:tRNA-modifying protein YgfZ